MMVARARGPALSGGGVIEGSSRPVPLTRVTIEPPRGQAVVVPPFVNTPDGSCPPRHCCDICLRKQPMRASSIVAAYHHLVGQKDLLHLGLHVDVVGRDVPVERGAARVVAALLVVIVARVALCLADRGDAVALALRLAAGAAARGDSFGVAEKDSATKLIEKVSPSY